MDFSLTYINSILPNIVMIAYIITIISCIGVMLSENRNPIRSLAWVMALIFLPVAGLVLYIFFGRSLKGAHMISRHNRRKLMSKLQPRQLDLQASGLSPEKRNLVNLSRNICSAFYTVNNRIEIFTTGHEKFAALKKDIINARKSIFLQYYIFSDDAIGHQIADLLIKKAEEGLEVKVIYDHVGSFSARNKFFKRMAEHGVETHPFFKVTFPQFANRINWRNHRKIVVIDGEIGYIGGMNIADRYEQGKEDNMGWRDTHFRVQGDIVESLIYSFLIDWNFKNPSEDIQFPEKVSVGFSNNVGMQLISAGPMSNYNNIALCFLKVISCAVKSIYIQTPYFLPTDALLNALQVAALSNVDVRIMIPRRGDSAMLRFASFSYVTECLKAGIKVYLYNPGMLHAKAMIIDDDLVTAGSTNFDFRSFENNFECNLMVYDKDFNTKMREVFFRDMTECTKLSFAHWHKRPWIQRAFESIIRLVSPIL